MQAAMPVANSEQPTPSQWDGLIGKSAAFVDQQGKHCLDSKS
jgi:hypothetical protein